MENDIKDNSNQEVFWVSFINTLDIRCSLSFENEKEAKKYIRTLHSTGIRKTYLTIRLNNRAIKCKRIRAWL